MIRIHIWVFDFWDEKRMRLWGMRTDKWDETEENWEDWSLTLWGVRLRPWEVRRDATAHRHDCQPWSSTLTNCCLLAVPAVCASLDRIAGPVVWLSNLPLYTGGLNLSSHWSPFLLPLERDVKMQLYTGSPTLWPPSLVSTVCTLSCNVAHLSTDSLHPSLTYRLAYVPLPISLYRWSDSLISWCTYATFSGFCF